MFGTSKAQPMKSMLEDAQAKMVEKNQQERFRRYIEVTNELLATGKALIFASHYDEACKQYARVGPWKSSDRCAIPSATGWSKRVQGRCQSLPAVTLWFNLPYVMASGSFHPSIDNRRTARH